MSPGCQQVIPSAHHKHRSKKIIWIKIKTNNGKFCFAKLSIFPGHHACCTWDEWNVSILSKNPLVCVLLQINQSTITLFPSLLLLNDLVWIFRGFVTWVCFEVFLWQTAPVYNTHIVVFCMRGGEADEKACICKVCCIKLQSCNSQAFKDC